MQTFKQKLETLLEIQQQIDELERRKLDRLAEYNAPVVKRIDNTLASLVGKYGNIDLSYADITVESGDFDSLDADGYRGGEVEYHADELSVEEVSGRAVISWWHSLGAYGDNGDRHTSYLSETDHWVIRELVRYISDEYGVSFRGAEKALIDDEDLEYYRNRLLEMATSLVIPDSVTEIGYREYANLPLLEEVRIPDGVTAVGEGAFANCRALKTVHLPESVTKIGSGASFECEGPFAGCSALERINIPGNVTEIGDASFIRCSSLTEIIIPERVTAIDSEAFEGCAGLAEIRLPDALTRIGPSAFRDCSSLTRISIPEGVTRIERSTFRGCSSLSEVIIPEGVTAIDSEAFEGCSSLKIISIPKGVTRIERSTFRGCSSLSEAIIPEGVTAIDSEAFEGCSSLTRISIPEGVTRIERSTFSGCSSLTEALIPEGVTIIDEEAFLGCRSLKDLRFPDSLTEIGNHALKDCSSITSIHVPDNVKEIGHQAFAGCSGIRSLSVSSGNGRYSSPDRCQAIMAGKDLIVGCKTTTVPEGTEEISAFGGWSGLEEAFIPDSVSKISGRAFSGCQELKRISIPRGLSLSEAGLSYDVEVIERVAIPESETEIAEGAFSGCTRIVEIRIPDGITRIGREAFSDCTGLTEIHIPGSVTEIGENAFAGCVNIKAATVSPENNTYDSREDCNGIIETSSNVLILGCENTVIPDSVTEIGEGAFAGCAGPEEVTVPKGVTKIGAGAFYCCTGLSKIFIPESVIEVGESAFEGCCNLVSLLAPEGLDLKAAKVPRRRGCSIITRYSPKRQLQTLKRFVVEMPGGVSIPVEFNESVDGSIAVKNWPVILETASGLSREEVEDALADHDRGGLPFFVLSVVDVLKGGYDRLPDVLPGMAIVADKGLQDELLRIMAPVLDAMGGREREVFTLYYGIGCRRVTLAAIGARLGITEERARQMKEKAYRRFKNYCPYAGDPEELKRMREERSEAVRRISEESREERRQRLGIDGTGREPGK